MSAIQLRENIYSVGVCDPDVRIFHGYQTPSGTSYNAFLVKAGEDYVLIDNVKEKCTDEFIRNIEEVVPLERIRYIIQNHIEPDHSGSLPAIAARLPEVPIYCTAGAQKGIKAYYGDGFACHIVKNGDTLTVGQYTFRFIPAPMVHWPDSMLTYLEGENILFSNDAFGQHICRAGSIYDVDLGYETLMEREADYYANIVLPYGTQVVGLLKQAAELPIDMICPAHGVLLREHIAPVLEAYSRWCKNDCDENKVVIAFDSMWGSTEEMAEQLAAEYEAQGKQVELYHLRDIHPSAIMGKLLEAKYIFVGASTLNRGLMPTVAAFLTYLKGLYPKNRVGMAFGSYGWGGESVAITEKELTALGWEMLPSRKQVYRGKA